ncbi:MAG TPA: riboflavin synthase [Gammaproteobacteria bacterium]|jgi:riboflavin synthase|nr:riboflavin synthase [Gammaproteobacteria bacterium]
MFTGIIQTVGKVKQLEAHGGDVRIGIGSGALDLNTLKIGDSVAVNGCCLTVIAKLADGFAADASTETLALTTLGALEPGSPVNLETALTLATPLGGHLVSGHVDGIGTVRERHDDARSVRFSIELPAGLAHYVAKKGSICVDGVSLTVNEVNASVFEVNIIPHTLEHTVIGKYAAGTRVNIEVDLVARYLERMLTPDS